MNMITITELEYKVQLNLNQTCLINTDIFFCNPKRISEGHLWMKPVGKDEKQPSGTALVKDPDIYFDIVFEGHVDEHSFQCETLHENPLYDFNFK